MGWLNLHENCQTRKLISWGKTIRFIASIKAICILKYDFFAISYFKNDIAKCTLQPWRQSLAY